MYGPDLLVSPTPVFSFLATYSLSLREREMNLYLYIPPHSAHPPGVLLGLVFGMVFRIHTTTLCSDPLDAKPQHKSSLGISFNGDTNVIKLSQFSIKLSTMLFCMTASPDNPLPWTPPLSF